MQRVPIATSGMDLNGRHHQLTRDVGRADLRMRLASIRNQEVGHGRSVGSMPIVLMTLAMSLSDSVDWIFRGELLVGVVEMRRAELLHDAMQRFLERSVEQDVGDGGNDRIST